MPETTDTVRTDTGPIVIENVAPRTPSGYPAKGIVGRPVVVSADIFREGHDHLAARVRYRSLTGKADAAEETAPKWTDVALAPVGNDRFEAAIVPEALGASEFVVEAWTDRLGTWEHAVTVKLEAGADVTVEFEEGARLLEASGARVARPDRARVKAAAAALRDDTAPPEARLAPAFALLGALSAGERGVPAFGSPDPADLGCSAPHGLWVDRERAVVGAWYELFPRSHGGLAGTAERLADVAAMGFDVVYLPPVHPIGRSHRKGANNALLAGPADPGSPWAIGSTDGGHTAIHPDLGTFADFDHLIRRARDLGLEIALDYALQCSPEHPWLAEHPEWFHHRPDGTIRYAENPPKKYQDIYPLNMWPAADEDRAALWRACKDIFDFWIGHGVRIFRVDNPHTKPFGFWEWVIAEVQAEHPDVLFLAEAFTRPKVMARLAEVGFSQSYTYFTWRNTKAELVEYLDEIALGPVADYMRPNFWPNTPDILSGVLRGGGAGAFKLRLVLAATMSPSYGIYSGYELCENEPASPHNEEYLNSEKYEVKHRDFHRPDTLVPFVTILNGIRRRHPALHELSNIVFHPSGNESILAFSKRSADDVILVVVNLDTGAIAADVLNLELGALGLSADAPYEAHDELTGVTYPWQGANPYVVLSPDQPAHVLHLRNVGDRHNRETLP